MTQSAFTRDTSASGGWWVEKDPDAVLDYELNWDATGQSVLDGDTIDTSTWIVEAGLTKASESNTTTTAKVWLSGGTEGTTYRVTNRIETAGGRVLDQSFDVRVAEQ